MIGRKPFFSGVSTLNQIEQIVKWVGYPTEETLVDGIRSEFATRLLSDAMLTAFTDDEKSFKAFMEKGPLTEEEQKSKWGNHYAEKLSPETKDDAVDLLYQLLQFDPRKRLTAMAGLSHSYCSQFADRQTETICATSIVVPDDCPDNKKLTVAKYRSHCYEAETEQCRQIEATIRPESA